jgi:DNA replication factor GINS
VDDFFQNLREIQKKERSLSSLSPVGDDFYQQISSYFNRLMEKIDNNPFSFESYLLRDAQRIVAEICERREHKIANSVVMNVQRSHQLFKDSREDGKPHVPLNSTPEEEKLYRELYQSLAIYRAEMRSPLKSYSIKKDLKFKSISPSPKKDSKTYEKGINGINENIINNSKNNVNDTANIGSPIGEETRAPTTDLDEIPPEIQDEIYKQFGKEPSQQNSKESSVSGKEKVNTDIINNSGPVNSSKREKVESPDNNDSIGSNNISNVQETPTEVLMILDELPSIMGVDSNVYGPFYPGDIITMPEPNARILIKNHKGKSIQRYK